MRHSSNDFETEEREFLGRTRLRDADACPSPSELVAAQSDALDPDATASIVAHLKDCERCRILVRDLTDPAQLSLKPEEEDRIWARVSAGGFQKTVRVRRSNRFWKPIWLVAATAVAVIAVGLTIRFSSNPPDQTPVITAQAPAPPSTTTVLNIEKATIRLPAAALLLRGDEQQRIYAEKLAEALKPYSADNFAEAVRLLEPVTAKFSKEPEGYFYLGVSLLLLGRNPEAVAPLESARRLGESALARDASWYLGLAHAKAGDSKQAITELASLCMSEGAHQAEACQGVQELSVSRAK